MPADAPADADPFCSLLRFPEHHRIPGSIIPLAAGHLLAGSVLHHATSHGRVDVRDVLDRAQRLATESAGEDDELHDAGDAHRTVPQLRIRAEPLLRRAKYRGATAAMAAGSRAIEDHVRSGILDQRSQPGGQAPVIGRLWV